MALTEKQEIFVQELLKGKSQREAYMIAYPKSKKWKPTAVDSNASTLLKNTKVLQRYNELHDHAISLSVDNAETIRLFGINVLKEIASGQRPNEIVEYDGEGNLVKIRRETRQQDIKDALRQLFDLYGVTTAQPDQTITVKFAGQIDEYGD